MTIEEDLAFIKRRLAEQIRVGELVALTDGGQRGTYGIRSLSTSYPDLGAQRRRSSCPAASSRSQGTEPPTSSRPCPRSAAETPPESSRS